MASLFTAEMSLPAFNIPDVSLSSRAMLCTLSISVWSARKHDPKVSEEIATMHGAQKDAGRYNKLLIPKKSLIEIGTIITEARDQHYYLTLPWADNGYRVLPAAAYMDHTAKMRELARRFVPTVDALVGRYEQLVADAKVQLGTMFKPEDYPGIRDDGAGVKLVFPEELRSKFSFETNVLPLPDAGDFRVALGDEEKARIKHQIATAVEASLQVASRELWQRLYDSVAHMAERLKLYKVTDEGVEHPFRDSVVTNLMKLVELLPKLNITNDTNLERMAEHVRASLVIDPSELRKSESCREGVARAAAAIAEQMRGYMGGYPGADATITTKISGAVA